MAVLPVDLALKLTKNTGDALKRPTHPPVFGSAPAVHPSRLQREEVDGRQLQLVSELNAAKAEAEARGRAVLRRPVMDRWGMTGFGGIPEQRKPGLRNDRQFPILAFLFLFLKKKQPQEGFPKNLLVQKVGNEGMKRFWLDIRIQETIGWMVFHRGHSFPHSLRTSKFLGRGFWACLF